MKPSLEKRQSSLFEQWNDASAIIHVMAEHPELVELEADDADPDGEDKIEELLKEERVTIVYDCCTLFESVAI